MASKSEFQPEAQAVREKAGRGEQRCGTGGADGVTTLLEGLALGEVEMARKACGKPMLPVLYFTNGVDESSRLQLAGLTVCAHPLPLSRLAHFIDSLSAAQSQAA